MSSLSNIHIATIGSVSVGKSTLLNALFVKQLSTTKMKRTTVLPSLFIENEQESLQFDVKQIRENIDNKNKELITNTENDEYNLTLNDCSVITYYVSKIFDITNPINPEIKLEIFDIPGLDDRKTKDVYFEWVKQNFHNFDIIFFVTKIDSGLNTTGEMEILQKIVENISIQKKIYDRTVYLIPIINKCDNMFYNTVTKRMEFNESNEEYYDIINQVNNIIETEFAKYEIQSYTKAVLLSTEEMFIYRSIYESNDIELNDKYINKIAINEYGKTKWNSYQKCDSYVKYIQELLDYLRSQKDKYYEYMQSCGYTLFNETLNNILVSNTIEFLKGHIKYEITKRPTLDELENYSNLMIYFYNAEKKINNLFNSDVFITKNTLGLDIKKYIDDLDFLTIKFEKTLYLLTKVTKKNINFIDKLNKTLLKINTIYDSFELILDIESKNYLQKIINNISINILLNYICIGFNINMQLKLSDLQLLICKINKLKSYFTDCKQYIQKYETDFKIGHDKIWNAHDEKLSFQRMVYIIVIRNLNNIFNDRTRFNKIDVDTFCEFEYYIRQILNTNDILKIYTLYFKYKLLYTCELSDFYYLHEFKYQLYQFSIEFQDYDYLTKLIKTILILVEFEIRSYCSKFKNINNELYKSDFTLEYRDIIHTKKIDMTIERLFLHKLFNHRNEYEDNYRSDEEENNNGENDNNIKNDNDTYNWYNDKFEYQI
jgi:GTPase Era involved in 16S rRNA processing